MRDITKYHLKYFSSRNQAVIDMIILHYISAINTHPEDPYNPVFVIDILEKYKISVHYLIDRNGNITELVPESQKSWHSGKSKWKGRKNLNRFSIGIELIGMDGDRYTERQYDSLIELLKDIVERRQIKEGMLIGHEHISPGRKIDPGRYMDWPKVYDAVYRHNENVVAEPVEPRPSQITPAKDGFLSIIRALFKF